MMEMIISFWPRVIFSTPGIMPQMPPASVPASHASRRYSARPPSSGRTGSRLKAHSTPLAPAAVVHLILPRIAAASKFANGPARADTNSCP